MVGARSKRHRTPRNNGPGEVEQQFGRQVAIALVRRNWEQAHAVVEAAKHDLGTPQAPVCPLDLAVAELEAYGLSQRTISLLESRLGILTVEQLLACPEQQLLMASGVGNAMICEIHRVLAEVGFGLEKQG